MSTQAQASQTRYGNWIKPRTPGIFGLGTIGTGIAMIGMVVVMIASIATNIGIGAIMLVVFAIVLVPLLYHNRDGRNGWQALYVRGAFARSKLTRRNEYAPDQLGELAFDAPPSLPGLLARSELIDVDQGDETIGVVVFGGAPQHYSVVIRTDAQGTELVDPHRVDSWVAGWGEFLKLAGEEEQIVGVSATVETAAEPGHGVAAEVARIMRTDAPSLSRDMLTQAASMYGQDAAEVVTWVSITWTAKTRDRRRLNTDEMIDMIANRLPGLLDTLHASGAGSVQPMSAAEIAERVRIAYDPDAASAFAEAEASGDVVEVPWEETGEAYVEQWGSLVHANVESVTWRMVEAPRQIIPAEVFRQLLRPARQGALTRKRVTFLYRPHPIDEAARIADNDLRTAMGHRQSRKGQPKAEDVRAEKLAEQTAMEQAQGAGMIRFAIMVTASVPYGTAERADATVTQLGTTARVRMRRVYGSQATAFQSGLGIGLVLSSYTRLPESVRDQL
jgi:hypothetical protein